MIVIGVIAAAIAAPGHARAERLPIQSYTTADGLSNDRVFYGARDVRGFLWFATADGLSRFDGNRFETFGLADGLPDTRCYDVIAAPDGTVWVATDHGLAWLDPTQHGARPRFTVLPFGTDPGDRVLIKLYLDRSGQIWFGSHGGLWQVTRDRRTATRVDLRTGRQPYVFGVAEDDHATMWIAASNGLIPTDAGWPARDLPVPGPG